MNSDEWITVEEARQALGYADGRSVRQLVERDLLKAKRNQERGWLAICRKTLDQYVQKITAGDTPPPRWWERR